MEKTLNLSEEEWRERLNPEEYRVLRASGTERPGTGALLHETRRGNYYCRGCGAHLFDAGAKFDSGCGWPSFYQAIPGSTREVLDTSHGMVRTEVRCKNCDSHLGHVFDDAKNQPTDQRYCMNSVSLRFEPDGNTDGNTDGNVGSNT